MSLENSLPAELRGPNTTITRVSAGLSGAGVYRVDAPGRAFVLKVGGKTASRDEWRFRIGIHQLAASRDLAPRVVHVDDDSRAVMSEFVADRSFAAMYMMPATREAAIDLLGTTIRRVHELPIPSGIEPAEPRERLTDVWAGLQPNLAVPVFVGDAVKRMRAAVPPERDRALVLSHNDVNPTNLVYDGARLLLLDWDVAAPNDAFYDLAAISVLLRMDEAACRRLLTAYDGEPVSGLPARFAYNRRLVAVLLGVMFLHLARQSGHSGATGAETLDSTPTLGEFYQRMRAGALDPATAEGQWWFGLALIKESLGSL